MRTNARVSPEQRELETKRAELAGLETELAQRELDLNTLRAELRAFEAQYLRVVGSRFAERDELEARLAEAAARQHPEDVSVNREAAESRARAVQSADATSRALLMGADESFDPTDALKRLYREIAKLVHPDLTTDGRERDRRNRVMAAANLAYAAGDEKRLQRILEEWETSPDFVEGEGIEAELVRTIRKIHQANQRLVQIEEELGDLRRSDLYDLRERFEMARTVGRDLVAEMADHLNAEIAQLRERWDLMQKGAVT